MSSVRRIAFLWSECYRGVELFGLWIGWTNPHYKRIGW